MTDRCPVCGQPAVARHYDDAFWVRERDAAQNELADARNRLDRANKHRAMINGFPDGYLK